MAKIHNFLSDTIRMRIPTGWSDLTDREAWIIMHLLTLRTFNSEDVPLMAMINLNRWAIIARNKDGFIVESPDATFRITPTVAAKLAESFRFIHEPPPYPWRPDRFRSGRPIPADLHTLTLADWLAIENYLQRVISSGDYALLEKIAPLLLRRRFGRKLDRRQIIALFYWLSSIKNYLRRRFTDFYSETGGTDPAAITPKMLQDAMDAQIRALTKGDITKESEVLKMPMYRALAELNALAREYREIKETSSK